MSKSFDLGPHIKLLRFDLTSSYNAISLVVFIIISNHIVHKIILFYDYSKSCNHLIGYFYLESLGLCCTKLNSIMKGMKKSIESKFEI